MLLMYRDVPEQICCCCLTMFSFYMYRYGLMVASLGPELAAAA
jgi:hypothetical protein